MNEAARLVFESKANVRPMGSKEPIYYATALAS